MHILQKKQNGSTIVNFQDFHFQQTPNRNNQVIKADGQPYYLFASFGKIFVQNRNSLVYELIRL